MTKYRLTHDHALGGFDAKTDGAHLTEQTGFAIIAVTMANGGNGQWPQWRPGLAVGRQRPCTHHGLPRGSAAAPAAAAAAARIAIAHATSLMLLQGAERIL